MKVYTYSEARRWLARVLDEAREGGEIRIKRRDKMAGALSNTALDGTVFLEANRRSAPLAIPTQLKRKFGSLRR